MSVQNENPFVGLRPFEADESLLFFGRQDQVLELLQRLHEHHFVAVIGSSGSGKSSLIRAGLIPKLKAGYLVNKRDHWLIATMKPGQKPLHNLAEAIINVVDTSGGHNATGNLLKNIKEEGADAITNLLEDQFSTKNSSLFILVDQFEELFRFSSGSKNKDEAIDFVNILLELAGQGQLPIYVVITMRSDFIGDCDQFYGLPEALNRSQYLVPRLNRVQLKAAIEGPVRLYGGKINPALTSKLLNEVQAAKDELPLLQHTLMRVWDYEVKTDNNEELDLNDYIKVGGIEKALSNHAEEAIKEMPDEDLQLSKKVFQSLTAVDDNGRKIRRPVRLNTLMALTGASKEQIFKIIHRFNEDKRSFVVVNEIHDEKDVLLDISHESLIRQWDRLGEWVDEEAESAKTYLQLVESATLYQNRKKDLLSGSELQIGLIWHKDFNPKAQWAHRYSPAYDDTIKYLFESENEQKKSFSQKKKQKRFRLAVMALSIILLLTLPGILWLSVSGRKVDKALKLITKAQEVAKSDPTVALRLAEQALKLHDDPVIESIAQNIYANNIFYKTIITTDNGSPVYISPDGRTIVAGLKNYNIQFWGQDGNKRKTVPGHRAPVTAMAFSEDSKNMVSASADGMIYLWDEQGASPIDSFKLPRGHIKNLKLSPSINQIVALTNSGTYLMKRKEHIAVMLKPTKAGDTLTEVEFISEDQLITGSKLSYLEMINTNDLNHAVLFDDDYNIRDGKVVSIMCNKNDATLVVSYANNICKFFLAKYLFSFGSLLTNSPIKTGTELVSYRPAMINDLANQYNEVNLINNPEKLDSTFGYYISGNLNGEIDFWVLHINFHIDKAGTTNDFDIQTHLATKLPGSGNPITSLAIVKDNLSFISCSNDGKVRLWTLINQFFNIKTGKTWNMNLNDFLKSGLIDELTPAQKKKYLEN